MATQPVILTNAHLRPSAGRDAQGLPYLSSVNGEVYASDREIVDVIAENLGGVPLLVPTRAGREGIAGLLDRVDGIFLPGAPSNLDPALYGEKSDGHPQRFDRDHDATDLFLIEQAKARNIPFFGICRAMQAMNVAFGGSLIQKIVSPTLDHSCSNPCNGMLDEPRYMHEVEVASGGLLSRLIKDQAFDVNSMHEQAVARLGGGLIEEATASDGIVEAISWPQASFFLGVQWHPECQPLHPVSQALFAAFREAVARRAALRL